MPVRSPMPLTVVWMQSAPAADACHCIRQGQAVIIMAVQVDFAGQQPLAQRANTLVHLMRLHDAERIRKADPVRPGLDGRIAYPDQELKLGAGSVFRGVANFQAQVHRIADVLTDDLNRLIRALFEF